MKDAFCAGGDADGVVDAPAGDGKDVVRVPGAAEELDEGFIVCRDVVVREPVLKLLLAGSSQRLDPIARLPRAELQHPVKFVCIQNQLTLRLFNVLCPIPFFYG